MECILMTVLSLSLSGSALGLIVLLLSRLFKKQLTSGLVYLCWALVVLRFALPVSGLIGLRAQDPAQGAAKYTGGAGFYSYYSRTEGLLTREDANEMPKEGAGSGQGASLPGGAQTGAAPGTALEKTGTPFYRDVRFWFALWLSGALLSFGGTLLSFGRFKRLLFRTLKPARPVDSSVLGALNASPYPALYRSDKVSSSLLLGLIRPVIVLPDREYSADDLDRVLRHELIHYRRGDLALKWLQALVYALHWFNPLTYLFRAQTTLYCELSCDQRLLKSMDRDDKRSYGELLLKLAADRALPRRVIAVSFTTQKRDLKERLVQIMYFKRLGKQALALGLALVMMVAGCAFVLGPARASGAQDVTVDSASTETFRVSSVNELLSALGSNRSIILAPGTYDLSSAAGYGVMSGPDYYWEDCYDGYTLVLDVINNLTLQGEGEPGEVNIVTAPRNAAVLKLLGCKGVTLKNLTAGHTELPDACQGPVLSLYASIDVQVDRCVLFGCGTLGIQADECWKLNVTDTVIKECTSGALTIANSTDVIFDGCELTDCKAHDGYPGYCLVEVYNSTDVALVNTRVEGNYTYSFVNTSNAHEFSILGCQVLSNRFECGFSLNGESVRVDKSSFDQSAFNAERFFEGEFAYALGPDGAQLDAETLFAMQFAKCDAPSFAPAQAAPLEGKLLSDGRMEYHVQNADELISALGSDRIIYLDGEEYLLSSAEQYGKRSGENCFWSRTYDGYQLSLIGVKNLTIVSPNGKARIETLPRSVDVLAFKFCEGVTLENLILGHIKGAGSCTGDVVSFLGCYDCKIKQSELYGCGVNGVNAYGSVDLHVDDTQIYECSQYAAVVVDCEGTQFNDVTLRDCGFNAISTLRCSVRFSGDAYYTPGYQPKDNGPEDYDDETVYDPEDLGFALPAPEEAEEPVEPIDPDM